jgi:hypothetical protein
VGDGDRNDEVCVGFRFNGSGDVERGDGVRFGGLALTSDIESAWKNLLAGCDLPTADRGGEDTSDLRELPSCLAFA